MAGCSAVQSSSPGAHPTGREPDPAVGNTQQHGTLWGEERTGNAMIKKTMFVGSAALLAGVFLFGRDVFSYVGTSVGCVKDTVRGSVPVEFEIERARKMVKDLVPDIRKNMHLVAKEEVEVERLTKQIADNARRLTAEKAELVKLRDDAASGKDSFQYAGHKYTAAQVKVELANRFDRFKLQDATLASLREMHQVRERSLEAAKQKLEGMLVAKRQLGVEVENLEARLKMLEARQTTSNYKFDDSRLSRAKELIGDLRSRLSVEERVADVEGTYQAEIPVAEAVAADDIVDQVTNYFAEQQPAETQPAETQTAQTEPKLDEAL